MNLLSLLGYAGPLSVILILIVLAQLSQRLGAVTKRPPRYRWLYVSAALIGIALTLRLWASEGGALAGNAALIYSLPLVVGLLIAAVVVWHYWGWLLFEPEQSE